MTATIVYTLVCPAVTDDRGNRVSGCGKGWTSSDSHDRCTTCHAPGQVRGQYTEISLKEAS